MRKIAAYIGILLIILFLAIGVAGLVRYYFVEKGTTAKDQNLPDPANATYTIDGESFSLIKGRIEKAITPDSTTKNILFILGEPLYGDFDADGDADAAAWLVNSPGGSGVFYYAVLVMNDGMGKTRSTNALLLGDRIAPQTLEGREGAAVYNYADRKQDDAMTAQPSVGKTLTVKYNRVSNTISE